MVRAINKDGMVSTFTDTAWNLLTDKNGYQEIDKVNKVLIPTLIKEFQSKQVEAKQEAIVVETKDMPTDNAQEMGIMREYLRGKGVKVSHLMGYDKLKKLYDDNKE